LEPSINRPTSFKKLKGQPIRAKKLKALAKRFLYILNNYAIYSDKIRTVFKKGDPV
jgi:hypothetical protein